MSQLTLTAAELFHYHSVLIQKFTKDGTSPFTCNSAKLKLGLILSEFEGKMDPLSKVAEEITSKYKNSETGQIPKDKLQEANKEVQEAMQETSVPVNIPLFLATDICESTLTTALAITLRKLFTPPKDGE